MSKEKPFLDRFHVQDKGVQRIVDDTSSPVKPRVEYVANVTEEPLALDSVDIDDIVWRAALYIAHGNRELILLNPDNSATVYNSVSARELAAKHFKDDSQ